MDMTFARNLVQDLLQLTPVDFPVKKQRSVRFGC